MGICSTLYCNVQTLAGHIGTTVARGISVTMAEGEGTASNAIWAVALIIIVAMIVGVVYYSGILKSSQKKEIDINVTVPSR